VRAGRVEMERKKFFLYCTALPESKESQIVEKNQ
jgi:hypothetical protein